MAKKLSQDILLINVRNVKERGFSLPKEGLSLTQILVINARLLEFLWRNNVKFAKD
jgi:hypothetical protein